MICFILWEILLFFGVADELYRRCCLYEEELREGKDNVRPSEVERRIVI